MCLCSWLLVTIHIRSMPAHLGMRAVTPIQLISSSLLSLLYRSLSNQLIMLSHAHFAYKVK